MAFFFVPYQHQIQLGAYRKKDANVDSMNRMTTINNLFMLSDF